MRPFAGATHLNADNVHEDWLDDDQASDFNAGVNGPIDRNEVGAFTPSFKFTGLSHVTLMVRAD